MNDTLSLTFAALAHPTRRAILARLALGEASISELAKPFSKKMSMPAITRHVQVLGKAGLVTKSKDAQWRPCKLNDKAFKDVAGWMSNYREYWEETFDRLDDYIKTVTPKKNERKKMSTHPEKEAAKFVITRTFAVAMATMFDLWTDPKHFSQWLPPKGFSMQFIRADIQPGGSSFYFMTNGSMKMYGRVTYLKIQRPDGLVYTQQFCDENEKITRHPASPTWPETMLTTIVFSEEVPGKTKLTLTWEPYGNVTAEEIETFVKAMGGMTQGWTGSFDKLDIYLSSL